MKNLTATALALLLILGMTSCSQEKVAPGIYAPNEALVSNSEDELRKTIASAIHEDEQQVAIKSIDFLDVKKGFIAEVDITTYGIAHTIYYISNDLNADVEVDSSVELVTGPANSARMGIVAYCSCGLGSFPSSECRVSITHNPNGTITGTCFKEGCMNGCVYHQE